MLAGNRLQELGGLCQGKPLLLLVDQLEELFTLCHDVEAQKTFGRLLTTLSAPGGADGMGACRILLTLRTDHLARLESNEVLQPLYTRLIGEGNHLYLSAIAFADIHLAIAEPAKRVGLRFVPTSLINRLASQTAGLASGLPLLQFALRRLWDTRPRDAAGEPLDLVTAGMVDALPDVQRALGTVADGVFSQFTPTQQLICERLLQELVVLDENFEEPLRRRRNEVELTRVLVARRTGTAADVDAVITQFVAAGLLRQFGEGPQRQIEVAHEALLRHWDHINRLVTGQEVKERLHLVKQIGREAAEWVSRNRPEGYLNLRGERLERALEYGREDWLAEAESAEYVEACRVREAADHERDAQRLAAKKTAERVEVYRRLWKLWALAATPLLLLLLALLLSLQRSSQRTRVEQQRALGLGLAGASVLEQVEQPSLLESSVLYAVASARSLREPNLGQIHALQQGLYLLPKRSRRLDHLGMVWSVAFNSDGSLVATASEDKTVRVFAVSGPGGKPVKELPHQQDVWTLAFSANGQYLATGGAGGARLFETTQWKEVWPQPFPETTSSLSFSLDGRVLALGGPDGTATALDVKNGAQLWHASYGGPVLAVAFSPDGRRVAVAADDPDAGLLDAKSGAVVRKFGRAVRAVAFSGDGRSLVTGSGNEARVLLVDSGERVGPAMHHLKTVVTVASSRDGRYVVTGSENTARVFEASSGRQVSSLTHGGAVNAVSLSADGHWVATGSSDGTARVFGALDGRETLRHSNDEQREVAAVAFSPSGQYVATGSAIFEAANGYQVARVPAPAGVNQMAVSADGDFLATISDKAFAVGESGRIRVVDLRTGKPVGPPFGVRDQFIAVSDRGRFVAAGDGGGVDIVDVASHASRTLDFPSEAVASLDLSPDGRFVVVADGKTVHLMDTTTGKAASTIPPFAEPVSVVAFSYDGKSFAVGSREPRVRVFSVATGQPLATVPDGLPHEFAGARCKPPSQPCRVSSLSFSRDGKHLATGSDDRTARVFDLGNGREEASLPHVGPVVYAVFTREDARYLATSSNDFIGRVFDVSSRNEMWHLPLRVDDFFPLQFTDRDKYVLWAASIGDEVLVERHPWRLRDMLDDACAIVSRDLTAEEWKPYSDLELRACPSSANRPR